MIEALFKPIPYTDPQHIYLLFHHQPWAIWLDSADATLHHNERCQYSYIAIDPFDTLIYPAEKAPPHATDYPHSNPFTTLSDKLSTFQLDVIEPLPPLQTGAIGFLSYDLCHDLEPIQQPPHPDLPFPKMGLGFYDLIFAFDHSAEKAWILSSGFPYLTPNKRLKRAKQRLQWAENLIRHRPYQSPHPSPLPTLPITPNFNQQQYEKAVKKIISYIQEGELFEANLSQRFSAHLPKHYDIFSLYLNLRAMNPAPFSAYMHFGQYTIASASPERFIKLKNAAVETRPIKGTCRRDPSPIQDKIYADRLLNSQKDRAENVMIVDLMRNDLSKVCHDESVHVSQLCAIESFKHVHHLVSVVKGKLRPPMTAVDLLKATFPGGSVTGAPKVRAMQVIAEIEPDQRGPYCGSMGYISFTGDMDTSIIIRSFIINGRLLTFHGGGAIVLQSNPRDEYDEACIKTAALKKLLSG